MSELWKDGFDHYGSGGAGVANALAGAWASWDVSNAIGAPAWGAATGPYCMTVGAGAVDNNVSPRRVLPAAVDELIIAMRFSQDTLPAASERALVSLQDGGNVTIATLYCTTTGQLVFERGSSLGAGTIIASSQGPILVAGTWQHVEMRVKVDGAVGTLEVRVDGVAVIGPLTGLNTGASLIAQLVFGKSASPFVRSIAYIDDLIVRDTSGTRNNDFEGDLRVVALYPNADTEVAGWTPRPRKKIGNGILDNRANTNSAVSAASSVSTDIGNADFTIETFIRLRSADRLQQSLYFRKVGRNQQPPKLPTIYRRPGPRQRLSDVPRFDGRTSRDSCENHLVAVGAGTGPLVSPRRQPRERRDAAVHRRRAVWHPAG
jgi:hypothetical protein